MKQITVSYDQKEADCPVCYWPGCKRHQGARRTVKDVGRVVKIKHSKHYCPQCDKVFTNPRVRARYGHWTSHSKDMIIYAVERLMAGRSLGQVAMDVKRHTGHDIGESTLHEWHIRYTTKHKDTDGHVTTRMVWP